MIYAVYFLLLFFKNIYVENVFIYKHTFNTGVKYSATPSAVPFTELMTLCIAISCNKKFKFSKSVKDQKEQLLNANIRISTVSNVLLIRANIGYVCGTKKLHFHFPTIFPHFLIRRNEHAYRNLTIGSSCSRIRQIIVQMYNNFKYSYAFNNAYYCNIFLMKSFNKN